MMVRRVSLRPKACVRLASEGAFDATNDLCDHFEHSLTKTDKDLKNLLIVTAFMTIKARVT